jgi:hypothetical protein
MQRGDWHRCQAICERKHPSDLLRLDQHRDTARLGARKIIGIGDEAIRFVTPAVKTEVSDDELARAAPIGTEVTLKIAPGLEAGMVEVNVI